MSTCGKYSQHQNENPDPCRPAMTSNSDLRVSIPAGFPTGIPVVSHGWPALVLSLKLVNTIYYWSRHAPVVQYSTPNELSGLYQQFSTICRMSREWTTSGHCQLHFHRLSLYIWLNGLAFSCWICWGSVMLIGTKIVSTYLIVAPTF